MLDVMFLVNDAERKSDGTTASHKWAWSACPFLVPFLCASFVRFVQRKYFAADTYVPMPVVNRLLYCCNARSIVVITN